MDKHVLNIPVYGISKFSSAHDLFWMEALNSCLARNAWLQSPHQQVYYLLFYLKEAGGTIEVDGKSICLEGDQVVCCKPNVVNNFKLSGTSTGYMIAFTEDFFALRFNTNVLQQFSFFAESSATVIALNSFDAVKWQQLTYLMAKESDKAKQDFKVLRSYLNILLHEIELQSVKLLGVVANQRKHEKILSFMQLLDKHFVESKSPTFYAEKLHITLNYLNKLCKLERKMTSGQLIRERVLRECKRLLAHTNLSVSEIAYQLGFESPSYFITFFKKGVGSTPEGYRKQN